MLRYLRYSKSASCFSITHSKEPYRANLSKDMRTKHQTLIMVSPPIVNQLLRSWKGGVSVHVLVCMVPEEDLILNGHLLHPMADRVICLATDRWAELGRSSSTYQNFQSFSKYRYRNALCSAWCQNRMRWCLGIYWNLLMTSFTTMAKLLW